MPDMFIQLKPAEGTGVVTAQEFNALIFEINRVVNDSLSTSGFQANLQQRGVIYRHPYIPVGTPSSGYVPVWNGSIFVPGSIGTSSLADNSVTNAKLAQMAALTVKANPTNATANAQDLAASSASDAVLRESGSALAFGTVATGGIANNAVTDAKIRDSAAVSVIGRSANSSGDPADIAAASNNTVLKRSSNALSFASVVRADTDFLTDWEVDSNFAPQNFGTVTNQSIWRKRIGDTMYVRGKFEAGTVVGADASIRMPSGYTIDTAKFAATANQMVGWAARVFNAAGPTNIATNGSGHVILFFDGSDTDDIFFANEAGSDVFVKGDGSALYSNSDTISFEFSVPIAEWDT